jgi:small nuclear ribonucleoprotein E
MRLQGKIIGFDEYMNLVLDAVELSVKKNTRRAVGGIMLRATGNGKDSVRPKQWI